MGYIFSGKKCVDAKENNHKCKYITVKDFLHFFLKSDLWFRKAQNFSETD